MSDGPVDNALQHPPCPHCKVPLPSPRARQCLRCHTDWHDTANVHRVDVGNWNRLGLDVDKDYVVELCQQLDGRRYTRYREYPNGDIDPCAVLETNPASAKTFLAWKYYEYAEHLKLTNGQSFAFEAHGIWLTDLELQFMESRQSWTSPTTPWVRGIPPMLPPK